MIITAALCWWNERPEDLDVCVRGIGQFADRIVALDGAYMRYPGATPRSANDQLVAIREAAAAVNLECQIVQPDVLWKGQVEKRSSLLALASVGSDWIATVDADHVITADREHVRFVLERVREDALEVAYRTPINPKRKMSQSAAGIWHIEQTEAIQYIPLFWRALAGIRVERYHWWYSAVKPGGKIWLWGGDDRYEHVYHGRMEKVEVEHRTLFRTPAQVRASRAFLNDRERIVQATDQEDWQPGMADPIYDYRRMPA